MTKEEFIARYGQERYDAHVAKVRERNRSKFGRKPRVLLTAEEHRARRAAYMKKWYAKQRGGKVRATKSRGIEGVNDGTYWQKWGQLPDVKNANRDRAKAAYQAKTPGERKAIQAKRYAARKAKLKADREFAAKAAAKQSVRSARWAKAHPETVKERTSAYAKSHPHVKRANKQTRRAAGKMSPDFALFIRQQPCLDCGVEGKSTIGHLIPVTKGGTNHPCNLVAQCRSCNSKQQARIHPRAMIAHYPQAALYAA